MFKLPAELRTVRIVAVNELCWQKLRSAMATQAADQQKCYGAL